MKTVHLKLQDAEDWLREKEKALTAAQLDYNLAKPCVEKLRQQAEQEEAEVFPWVPEDDKLFYYVHTSNSIFSAYWDGDHTNQSMFASGNVFRTEAEAQQVARNRVIMQELRAAMRDDWVRKGETLNFETVRQTKYQPIWDHLTNTIEWDTSATWQFSEIAFATRSVGIAAFSKYTAVEIKAVLTGRR